MKQFIRKLTVKLCLLVFGLSYANTYGQTLTFSVNPGSNTICTNGGNFSTAYNYIQVVRTSTVPGAGYYTYTLSPGCSLFVIQNSGATSTLGVICTSPGTHTITGLAYVSNSNSVILSSYTQTITALSGPTVNIAGPSTVCPNSVITYTASGTNAYIWYGNNGTSSYSLSGSVASMTFGTSSSQFSVVATSSNGCSNTTTMTPSLNMATVTISQSTICVGNSATLSATGASFYIWSNSSNSSSIVVTPTVTTTYSLIAATSNCTTQSSYNIAVTSPPTITVSPSQTICAGTSIQISAMGASSYSWSNGIYGANNTVSPNASICYSVLGSFGGCVGGMQSVCITVISSPTLSVSATPGFVCLGSSITFNASGGNTYTWSTNANTSSINVIPLTSQMYSVTASHTLNSCLKTVTINAIVSPSCADVWPGDANRDGVANNSDILELGFAANSTGAARSSTSIAWSGQYANAWSGTVSTGWNKCHADCNGDGVVDALDANAVSANFALTHAFKPSASSQSQNDLSLVPQQSTLMGGNWNSVDIMTGDAASTVNQFYGTAFEINYDQSMIQQDSVKLIYSPSFLNSGNQNIEFAKDAYTSGKIYAATVRTDGNNVSGKGKIAEFRFKLKTGIAEGSTFNFGITNGNKASAPAQISLFSTSGSASLNVSNSPSGVVKNTNPIRTVCFPIPANDKLFISNNFTSVSNYMLLDITGRALLQGSFTGTAIIDLSEIPAGSYIIKSENPGGDSYTKLIINK